MEAERAERFRPREDAAASRLAVLKDVYARKRAQYVAEGVLPDPSRPGHLDDATKLVGTCMDMCPEYERVEREVQKELDRWEVAPGTTHADPALAVKIYRRPAAGRELPLPEEVRPPHVLQRTLDYLFHTLLPASPRDPQFAAVQPFLWNRTRAIRQDFIVQSDRGALAIACHERIARYHILCLHWKGGEGAEAWSEQQELEQLRKTLRTLMEDYDDQRALGHTFPTEAEFRAYNVLLHPRDAEALREVELLPTPVFLAEPLQWALSFRALIQRSNLLEKRGQPSNTEMTPNSFTRAFQMLNTASYLTACLAENLFPSIRIGAVKTLARAYLPQHNGLAIAFVTRILGMDNDEETVSFLRTLHVDVLPEGVANINRALVLDEDKSLASPFSEKLVESKRGNATCQAIINGLHDTHRAHAPETEPKPQAPVATLPKPVQAAQPMQPTQPTQSVPRAAPQTPMAFAAPAPPALDPKAPSPSHITQAAQTSVRVPSPAPAPAPTPAPAPAPTPAPRPIPSFSFIPPTPQAHSIPERQAHPPPSATPPVDTGAQRQAALKRRGATAKRLADYVCASVVRECVRDAAGAALSAEHARRRRDMRASLLASLVRRLERRLLAEPVATSTRLAAMHAMAMAFDERATRQRAMQHWQAVCAKAQERRAQAARLAEIRALVPNAVGRRIHRNSAPTPASEPCTSDAEKQAAFAAVQRDSSRLWEYASMARALVKHVARVCEETMTHPPLWTAAAYARGDEPGTRWLQHKLGLDRECEWTLPNGTRVKLINCPPDASAQLVMVQRAADVPTTGSALLGMVWTQNEAQAVRAAATQWQRVEVVLLEDLRADPDALFTRALTVLVPNAGAGINVPVLTLDMAVGPLREVWVETCDAFDTMICAANGRGGARAFESLTNLANVFLRYVPLPQRLIPEPERHGTLPEMAVLQMDMITWENAMASLSLLRSEVAQSKRTNSFKLGRYMQALLSAALSCDARVVVPVCDDSVYEFKRLCAQATTDLGEFLLAPASSHERSPPSSPRPPKRVREDDASAHLRDVLAQSAQLLDPPTPTP